MYGVWKGDVIRFLRLSILFQSLRCGDCRGLMEMEKRRYREFKRRFNLGNDIFDLIVEFEGFEVKNLCCS